MAGPADNQRLLGESISQAPTSNESQSHYSQYFNRAAAQKAAAQNNSSGGSRFKLPNNEPLKVHRRHQINDFLERFQGKTQQMQKDGHLGVIQRTSNPIEKPELHAVGSSFLESSFGSKLPEKKQAESPVISPGKSGRLVPLNFHRRNISEIVVLQSSSAIQQQPPQPPLQPVKAQTSPEKRSLPLRREELSRQYEKLKSMHPLKSGAHSDTMSMPETEISLAQD